MTQKQTAQFLDMFRTLTNKVANLESRLVDIEEDQSGESDDDGILTELRIEIDEFVRQLESAVLPEPEAAIAS